MNPLDLVKIFDALLSTHLFDLVKIFAVLLSIFINFARLASDENIQQGANKIKRMLIKLVKHIMP